MGYKIRNNTLYVDGTVDGKRYRLSTGKEATPINIQWISKKHREVLLQLIDKDKPKIVEMFNEFALQSLEVNKHSIKPTTHRIYTSMLDKHIMPYFKHYRLDEIKPSSIKTFQSKLLNSMDARSVKNVRNLLSKILEDAKMDEIIDRNPVKLVKPPKFIKTDEITPFTLEEVMTILENANEFMRTFLNVAFFTGMRTGEVMALRWEDIDFNKGKIIVRNSITDGVESNTKTGKTRIIDMLDPVQNTLKHHYVKSGLRHKYIFTSRKGTPYTKSSAIVETYWKPLLKRCAMAYRVLYSTRHTFATIMLKNGEDLLWVSKTLGHANISTTMKYYIKYVEEKGQKRAEFLNEFSPKIGTKLAQQENEKSKSA